MLRQMWLQRASVRVRVGGAYGVRATPVACTGLLQRGLLHGVGCVFRVLPSPPGLRQPLCVD